MRYQFTRADCRRGGLARAAQPSYTEMCSKGFWAVMEKHPFYARHYLKLKIRAYYAAKARRAP